MVHIFILVSLDITLVSSKKLHPPRTFCHYIRLEMLCFQQITDEDQSRPTRRTSEDQPGRRSSLLRRRPDGP